MDQRFIPRYVELEKWILERRTWVYYLIWPDISHLKEIVKIEPGEEFYKVFNKHMAAYINEGQMPPQEIASAIMNLADDFMSGREMVFRTGDYVAIQSYIRGQKVGT